MGQHTGIYTANINKWVGQHAGILSKTAKNNRIRGGSTCTGMVGQHGQESTKYFNCNWIMAFFSGTLCIGQTIGFENDFAEENINLLKANFTKYSGNEWRKYIPNVSNVFIQALLTKDDHYYNIQYLFLNNK